MTCLRVSSAVSSRETGDGGGVDGLDAIKTVGVLGSKTLKSSTGSILTSPLSVLVTLSLPSFIERQIVALLTFASFTA